MIGLSSDVVVSTQLGQQRRAVVTTTAQLLNSRFRRRPQTPLSLYRLTNAQNSNWSGSFSGQDKTLTAFMSACSLVCCLIELSELLLLRLMLAVDDEPVLLFVAQTVVGAVAEFPFKAVAAAAAAAMPLCTSITIIWLGSLACCGETIAAKWLLGPKLV